MGGDSLTQRYFWMLLFSEPARTHLTQLENNEMPRSERLDVNRLDLERFRPFMIVLVPRIPTLPLVHRLIPHGCQPYYAGVTQGSTSQVRDAFWYQVGYRDGRHRVYAIVNPKDGTVRDGEDYDG